MIFMVFMKVDNLCYLQHIHGDSQEVKEIKQNNYAFTILKWFWKIPYSQVGGSKST